MHVFVLSAILHVSTSGQDGAGGDVTEGTDPPPPAVLQSVFTDDFATDSRGGYQVRGDVAWKRGVLQLGEGASIERTVRGGSWAAVTLQLNPTDPESPREIRLWLTLRGASQCCVRLLRSGQPRERRNSISVIDTGEQDGRSVEQVIREASTNDGVSGGIVVEYRNGLVRVTSSTKLLLVAYIDNGHAEVASVALESTAGRTSVDGFSVTATPHLGREYTVAEREQLARAAETAGQQSRLYRQGQYAEAVKRGEQALKIREIVVGRWHPLYATSLNGIATAYYQQGKYAQAEPLFLRTCDIQRRLVGENHPEYARSANNLASLYTSRGEFDRALPLYQQCRMIWGAALGEQDGDYARSLNNLAYLHERIGRYARAESLYKQARNIWQADQRSPDYATSLHNLASLYDSMGEYARAEPLYTQSRDLWKSLVGERHPRFAQSLNNLGALYVHMGDTERAEPIYQQSLEVWRATVGEEHPAYAETLNNLAILYLDSGKNSQARMLYEQSYAVRKRIGGERHPDVALSLMSLAMLHYREGDYARAESRLTEAIEIQGPVLGEGHPTYATSRAHLAGLYHSTGDERAKTEALAARDSLLVAASRTIPSLSSAQTRSWLEKHSPRADVVLSILRSSDTDESEEAYETVWQTKLLASRLRVGQRLAPDATSEARRISSELRDARLRLASLASASPPPDQSDGYRTALAAASRKKEEMEQSLAELNPASKRELLMRDASISDLRKALPPGVAVVDFVRVNNMQFVDEVREVSTSDGGTEKRTVKQTVGGPVYDVFVLRAGRGNASSSPASWIHVGPAEPIETALSEWRRELSPSASSRDLTTSDSPVRTEPSLRRPRNTHPSVTLRHLIWDRVEPHLQGIHTVVIIPDGVLSRLPWAALPGRQQGDYLLHDYALTTASSGQQLFGILSDPPIRPDSGLLVAGGVQYDAVSAAPTDNVKLTATEVNPPKDERQWAYLDGTAAEASAVAGLWSGRGRLKRLEGAQAKERALAQVLPEFRFAHLATHGFFDTQGDVYQVNLRDETLFGSSGRLHGATAAWRNPLLMTGLVLAGANGPFAFDEHGAPIGGDGILTAEEIAGLDLRNTELVTLSACETGLGDVASGQGVFGLRRVMHAAGVRSVVASLWKVDDLATQELMKQFYANLWTKEQSKVEALRNAQLWILQNVNQLEQLGVREPRSRGGVRKLDAEAAAARDQTSPYFWAAFTLSGDWR